MGSVDDNLGTFSLSNFYNCFRVGKRVIMKSESKMDEQFAIVFIRPYFVFSGRVDWKEFMNSTIE